MIISLEPSADPEQVARALAAAGLWVQRVEAGDGVHFVVEPHSSAVAPDAIARVEGVAHVAARPSSTPCLDRMGSVVEVGGVAVGAGARPVVMAGPCSVESPEQVRRVAARLAPLGVRFLRGGAYKPRTSPYAFQGHGEPALRWMRDAARAEGMRVVTEALGAAEVPLVAEYADLIQVGSRNMHNYALLRTVGAAGRPVLLKRGMAATLEEWLASAEYLLSFGAPAVVFCERGIRSFDPQTRNVLDLGAVALLSHVRRLPVIVDPSHATGRRDLVPTLARAALAAGAAGLMVETHDAPGEALSDGPQALDPAQMSALMASIVPETPDE